MADVATAANVDVSTASRVLNNDTSQRVAALTRERIVAVANKMNYRPNPLGRGLRNSRTYSLGISIPQLENPVFAQIIEGAEMAARKHGYSLLISHVKNLAEDPGAFERLELMNRVDGLIVSTLEEDKFLRAALARTSLPFVLVNRRIRGIVNSVVFDGKAAALLATERLTRAGHRRIGFLAGRLTGFNGLARLRGYREALRMVGVSPDPSWVVTAGYTAEGGERGMYQLLDSSAQQPTAVVASTLLSAAGALRALHARGVPVPAQISIASIQDAAIGQLFYPQLTTVKLPLFEMGSIAADGLIAILNKRGKVVSRMLAPLGLIERDSVATPLDI
ncbi:MAG: LacI family transcriptional regulator [Burkholderiaceae bacterium]|nr:LacI family transcriptional regulator [Burkholderiaceae bacterium]